MEFSSVSSGLTGITWIVDRFVCLDEDVPRVKGQHQYSLLHVDSPKGHFQSHKFIILIFAIQQIRGKL